MSSENECSVVCVFFGEIRFVCSMLFVNSCMSRYIGSMISMLLEIVVVCVWISVIIDVMNVFMFFLWLVLLSLCVSVGVVIVGCLVVSVKCRKCISMKLVV